MISEKRKRQFRLNAKKYYYKNRKKILAYKKKRYDILFKKIKKTLCQIL